MPKIMVEIEWDESDASNGFGAADVEQGLNRYYRDTITFRVVECSGLTMTERPMLCVWDANVVRKCVRTV